MAAPYFGISTHFSSHVWYISSLTSCADCTSFRRCSHDCFIESISCWFLNSCSSSSFFNPSTSFKANQDKKICLEEGSIIKAVNTSGKMPVNARDVDSRQWLNDFNITVFPHPPPPPKWRQWISSMGRGGGVDNKNSDTMSKVIHQFGCNVKGHIPVLMQMSKVIYRLWCNVKGHIPILTHCQRYVTYQFWCNVKGHIPILVQCERSYTNSGATWKVIYQFWCNVKGHIPILTQCQRYVTYQFWCNVKGHIPILMQIERSYTNSNTMPNVPSSGTPCMIASCPLPPPPPLEMELLHEACVLLLQFTDQLICGALVHHSLRPDGLGSVGWKRTKINGEIISSLKRLWPAINEALKNL